MNPEVVRRRAIRAADQAVLRGTAWAGYQAVVEYLDHYQPVRVREDLRETARANRALSGTTERTKQFAFTRLAEFAGV